MTSRTGDIAITPEGWAASTERQRAEIAANPQLAAMAKANAMTKDEQAQIDAADAAVREAEAAVGAAGLAASRARRGLAPLLAQDGKRPGGFFLKRPETYRAARASLPALEADLSEAPMALQNAIRRRNGTVAAVNRARRERRQAAKLKHAPKPQPVRSRNDGWGSPRSMQGWSGRDAG